MNIEDLKKYLSHEYQGSQSFLENIIYPIFGEEEFVDGYEAEILDNYPEYRKMADATGIRSVKDVGMVYIDGEPLQIFDISVSDRIMMERNRVTIQSLVRRIMDQYSNAFMLFHYEDIRQWNWRFTYCHKSANKEESTDSKRYTFLLGPKQSCRTAAENFVKLYEKRDNLMLLDIEDAFSVEALSDRFFNEYKEKYANIIFYITGKRMVKKGNKWEEVNEGQACRKILDEFSEFDDPEKAVRDYVKKLMGRLVFLQFLQKKGWLGVSVNAEWGSGDSEFIQNLFAQTKDKDHFIDNVLEVLFNDLNTERESDLATLSFGGGRGRLPYLNGGLFERDATDEAEFPLPAEYMQSLLEFFSRYNFTIDENDPDDAEVGVDPEMLGRIFENLLEDNKDKGAFYTPKEIVTYMCRESLIAYLQTDIEDEATKEALRQFVTTHDVTTLGTNAKFRQQVDDALKDVKICDPAIGSGAFPMGLLKELFLCRTALEGIEQDKAAEIKKHIIQQNIYGVDIEKGAVDIARLRFWLSLIVDEKTPHALPNLDYKIVEGNSLITTFDGQYIDLSTNIGTSRLRSSLVRIRPEKIALQAEQRRFYTLSGDEKYRSEIAIKNHILNIIWYQLDYEKHSWEDATIEHAELFGSTSTKGRKKNAAQVVEFTQERQTVLNKCEKLMAELNDESKSLQARASVNIPFFEWQTVFSEIFEDGDKKGFDIVIGNPPYVKEYIKRSAFDGFRETSPYYIGKMDLWYGFACHGIDMLKSNGILCFIAQNNWTTSAGAKLMRKKVVEDAQILQMVDFFTYMVFDDADIQTMVMLFRHNNSIDNYNIDYRCLTEGAIKEDMLLLLEKKTGKTKYLSPLFDRVKYKNKLFTLSGDEAIIKHISKNKTYLEDNEIAQGIVFPQDFLNKKGCKILGHHNVGDGVFGLSTEELNDLDLSEKEMELIKPYYTTDQLFRYYSKNNTNTLWMIYTDSTFKNVEKMKHYPKIKRHIDQFLPILTSNNKPYGLHRSRKEKFFKGEKIISLRKCVGRPKFTYSNFDCYVTQTFFVIQTNRFNLKYLTGILNSNLICFWLRVKGKMQGENYQVDKEPLMNIPLPIVNEAEQESIAEFVNQIIESKMKNPSADTSALETEIDSLVYQLYGLTYDEVLIVDPETPITREEYDSYK